MATYSGKSEIMERDGTLPAAGGDLTRQDASGMIASMYHKSFTSE